MDPEVHHFPPERLEDISVSRFTSASEPLVQEQEPVEERLLDQDLPPSTPPSPSPPSSADYWEEEPEPTLPVVYRAECWCKNKEIDICTCGSRRPETPPTPPSVVLWTPGAYYLPS